MADFPEGLLYSEEHEYLMVTDDSAVYTVGITDYAQGELGDIVYLELPSAGESFGKMDVFGTIEAVKAVSDLFSPITGEVVEVNAALQDDPSVVNSDPYGAGWMVKIRMSDESELEDLMDSAAYQVHVGE
ncbi:MAG: glycine cleavage system protein GcvH [Gemmatimonadota bacterium]|nr:MAG: glycine cleavage system protein GcvH [Gemmatimonadota bacterium]